MNEATSPSSSAPGANSNGHEKLSVDGGVDRLSEPVDVVARPRLPFTVVGVGASAGGLEAYTEFLQHCEPNSGMAFVLIQHLSPKHQSMLAELLSKHTAMPVLQVEDGQKVEPNHVYVIRPGFTMTIHDGKLHLGESAAERMHRRPVDDFFKSLAEEQRERAVAVILSGTGSNGTLGCESIKTVGGFCVAEDPQTAKYPSMPRSLIDSNLADAILKPKEMFAAISAYAAHPYTTGGDATPEMVVMRERRALGEIIAVLRTRTRHDFSVYKKPTLIRRIQRRMSLLQIDQMAEYARQIRQTPNEITALADDLLIHVTGFFRDAEVWESLRTRVIEPLVAEKPDNSSIRCWVTACSSGEEAYTIGILLLEAMEKIGKNFDIKIFATDTAERSLSQARAGMFPGGIEGEVTPDRLARFFDRDETFYRVKKQLRELVVFAPQNVLQDPPFSRLDLCTCRNLLIYIEGETQRRILTMLHFGLREGGTLLLGNSETITGAEDLFEPVDKPHRIYRRIGPSRHGALDFPIPQVSLAARTAQQLGGGGGDGEPRAILRASIPQLANKTLLDQYTPAAVVIDRGGQVVFYHGRTGQFLIQPTGEPTREILTLSREEIRGAVRAVLQKVLAENTAIHYRDGTIGEGSERRRVELTASPLGGAAGNGYYLISFQTYPDPPPLSVSNDDALHVNQELSRVRDELQSTIEELQTSNEEMKAAHEEVTSINEELQSSNEELETSKEELQSLNEELSTVNAQLHAKMEEVERTGSDLSSLLVSIEIAVVFLDPQFRIRRYTPPTKELVELIPSDVGRPLNDLAWKFSDSTLMTDAQAVLEKLVPIERELTGHNGRTYVRRVLPYRTVDDRINGVVMTFVDATDRRRAEASARSGEAWLSSQKAAFQAAVADEPLEVSLRPLMLNAIEQTGVEGVRCAFYIADGDEREMRHVVGVSDADVKGIDGLNTGADSIECGPAISVRAPMITPDVDREPRWERWRDVAKKHDFRAVWSFPIETVAGRVVGSFVYYFKVPRPAAPRDFENAAVVTTAAAIIISRHTEAAERAAIEKTLQERELESQKTVQALSSAKENAEASSLAKDEFLATLSHELRTPLSTVMLWSKLMQTEDLAADNRAHGLRVIEQSAETQKALIDDLLDSARIASGKLRLEMRNVNLRRLVSEAVEAILPTVEIKGLRIETDLGDVGTVYVDPDRMRQVVWNLLTNAVKFTPSGGIINVGLWRLDHHLRLQVKDTGRGIDPGFLPHIFERFRQADPAMTRTQGGIGLGLSIVKHLVELHGGSISAESQGLGKGAMIAVDLPLPKLMPPAKPSKSSLKKEGRTKTNALLHKRLLIVEDDLDSRAVLSQLLDAAGAEVTPVADAPEALRELQTGRYDVLVSDIGLPGMNGLTLMRERRKFEKENSLAPIRSIALTAFVQETDQLAADKAGFDTFITKPFDPEMLILLISKLSKSAAPKQSGNGST